MNLRTAGIRRPPLRSKALVLIAAAIVVALSLTLTAALASGGGSSRAGPRRSATPQVRTPGAATQATAATPATSPRVPSDPRVLAADLRAAQRTIDATHSSQTDVQRAGEFEQLATRELEVGSARPRRKTLAALTGSAAASMRANLAAANALSTLVSPQRHLPRWRIVAPPAPPKLLGYFRAAEARYRVPWQALAAIEFIETRFGRIRGLSTAGAEGPMQFLPATWARYGKGDVNNPKDAILGAARYLVASGARTNLGDALYRYNHSRAYVRAVQIYAGRMRADVRAFFGYYYWQVLYDHVGATVILAQGYPRVRPIPLP